MFVTIIGCISSAYAFPWTIEKPATTPLPFIWVHYRQLDPDHFYTANNTSPLGQYTFSIDRSLYCSIPASILNISCLGNTIPGVDSDVRLIDIKGFNPDQDQSEGFHSHDPWSLPPVITTDRKDHTNSNYYYDFPSLSVLTVAGFTIAHDDRHQLIFITWLDRQGKDWPPTEKYRGFVISPKGTYMILK